MVGGSEGDTIVASDYRERVPRCEPASKQAMKCMDIHRSVESLSYYGGRVM